MVPALATFITATALFLAVAVVVQVEHFQNRRLFLTRARAWLDRSIVTAASVWRERWNHFVEYILKLGWYYSMHSLLRTLLRLLVSMYTYVEHLFERNRTKTKQLRQERKRKMRGNHLTAIAEHKAEVALTQSEQAALRTKKLEHDH